MGYKISVAGAGYVGMSNALLLAQKNEVVIYDIDKEKIQNINNKISPIDDKEVISFLKSKDLNLTATCKINEAFREADYAVVSVPTNYDVENNFFDLSLVESVIQSILEVNTSLVIIIKSTIPIGCTENLRKKFNYKNIIFSPEFLREGKALHDNLYPSRIIIGSHSERARIFTNLLEDGALKSNIDKLYIGSSEAEAVKLFSNTYLAMRISYFNELDTFAEIKGMKTKDIIDGMSLDPRIGNYYNNPSFGYGGYCLPKDTKQLLANYQSIPQNLIKSIVDSNSTRMDYIADKIISRNPHTVGIYRLIMKSESDNFRVSATEGIINRLKKLNINIIVYEPRYSGNELFGCKIEKDLEKFTSMSDLIVTNRYEKQLEEFKNIIYTRDIYGSD
jgi:UDPglucose 6-dehydrogenase